eukprot:gene5096-8695_t
MLLKVVTQNCNFKFLKENQKVYYVTRSSKKRKRIETKLELLKPPKYLPRLPSVKNFEILGSILDVTNKPNLEKTISTIDEMKKSIIISNFQNFMKPNYPFSKLKEIRKKIENREKEKVLNLKEFQSKHNIEEIGDLKTFQSIFIHSSSIIKSSNQKNKENSHFKNIEKKKEIENENKYDNFDERLSLLGESILDSFISSFLLQNFEYIEIKWKKEMLDTSLNSILNKVVNDLNFDKLIIIEESNENYIIEKFKITSLLRMIGYIYLKLGLKKSLKFIENSILSLILKYYNFEKKFNYKKEIEDLFAHKFNCYPKYEIELEQENKFIISLYSSSPEIFYGISEGISYNDAIENVSREVFNNLTRFDFSKDYINYK